MSDPAAARVRLGLADARALCLAALAGARFAPAEAAIVADHLIDAASCGYEYSGLPKVLQIAANPKRAQPVAPLTEIHSTPVSLLLDGGNENGMVTLHHATDAAIARAGAHGFALVGVCNSWMSGRSAYYVERIARAGLIGLHTVGASSLVAPPGAARPAYGTNPVAFGFPTEGEPLVIDVSTAAFPGTELDFHQLLGLPLPAGVAIDAAGLPTTDPAAAKRGALLPFGGHKGFAIALAMQALGVLAGAGLSPGRDYGYLLIAIRPDLLVPEADFRRETSAMLARIKAVPRQPGVAAIRLPAERSQAARTRAQQDGIAIDQIVHERLLELAARAKAA